MGAVEKGRAQAVAAALALAAFVAWGCNPQPNVDNWFMLATGEWVSAHGIPEVNPFAPEGADYPIVVQQWAYCVLLYLFHGAGGWNAVGVMNGMFSALMAASLVFALRSYGMPARRMPALAAPVLLAALFESAIRPHTLDMAAWLYLAGAMARLRAGDRRWALAAPAAVALHANLHLAAVPLDALVVALHALPAAEVGRGRWSIGRPQAAPAAVAAGCLAAGCLTPYGPAGLAFPFWGSAGASHGGVIAECMPIWSPAGVSACVIVAVVCTAVVLVYLLIADGGRVDLASAALLALSLAATCLRARFYPLMVVSWVPALARALPPGGGEGAALWSKACRLVTAGMAAAFAATVAVTLACSAGADPGMPSLDDPSAADIELCAEAIRSLGASDGDAVLTTPATGGYLECAGFRVTMDSCTERWSQPMPGGGLNRDLFDFYDSVNRREGAAGRYVSRWEGSVGWAVVGSDALSCTAEFVDYSWPKEGTVVGYLDGSPSWERVGGEWERGGGGQPVYVYRKVA